ncbi:hypothetical protein R3P38DRAFT_3346013 [Favolaschia claudopus]|uniref:Uncharacterized protein n=1 Tax=Favolaschia claudopus TaxID=2862362 RepID=A0AAW0DCU1_9AGAR
MSSMEVRTTRATDVCIGRWKRRHKDSSRDEWYICEPGSVRCEGSLASRVEREPQIQRPSIWLEPHEFRIRRSCSSVEWIPSVSSELSSYRAERMLTTSTAHFPTCNLPNCEMGSTGCPRELGQRASPQIWGGRGLLTSRRVRMVKEIISDAEDEEADDDILQRRRGGILRRLERPTNYACECPGSSANEPLEGYKGKRFTRSICHRICMNTPPFLASVLALVHPYKFGPRFVVCVSYAWSGNSKIAGFEDAMEILVKSVFRGEVE